MLLLVQRPEAWPEAGEWADAGAAAQWRALLGLGGGYSLVEAEVAYLREQLLHMEEVLASGHVQPCSQHDTRLDCAAHGH